VRDCNNDGSGEAQQLDTLLPNSIVSRRIFQYPQCLRGCEEAQAGVGVSRFEIKILAAMTVLSVVILAAAGRFAPQVMPDTPSYLNLVGFPAMLAQPRAPLYGWLVAVLDLGRGTYVVVPAFHIATYLAAVWFLVAQLRRYGLSAAAGLSIGAALLSANALLIDASWVHPELLSITCALAAVAAAVRLADTPGCRWAWALVGTGATFAYVLRPSFLLLVVVLPALHACLIAIRGDALRVARVAAIFVVTAAPFAGIATLRAATVGDFNIVSFGGFAMSGMATLMLSDDVVARLPADVRPYAAQVLAARRAGEDSGRFIGIPRNASEVRSFHSVAIAYFDVLARTYDNMLYDVIAPTQGPSESWIDFNRRLMRFSFAVVRAAPDRYAAWIVGATTRMLGRSITTNLPAMLAILVVAATWTWRLFRTGEIGVTSVSRLDVPVMAVLAILWLVGAGLLTMFVIAPSTRYVETSSLLVAAPLIYWAALLIASTRAQSRAKPSS
jgi:hypothetical protein